MEAIIFALIGVNVIAFILPTIIDFSGGRGSSNEAFLRMGWNSASDIKDGEYYRLISSMFLHGDFFHILVNMYSLYVVGFNILEIFGSVGFFLIYLFSGIGGSIASFALHPRTPSVGASGAIFGLVGSLLAFSILSGQTGLLGNIIIIIAVNLVIGFTSGGRIDNYGHIGGLVTGTVIGLLLILGV